MHVNDENMCTCTTFKWSSLYGWIVAKLICAKVKGDSLPHTPNADLVPTLYGNK